MEKELSKKEFANLLISTLTEWMEDLNDSPSYDEVEAMEYAEREAYLKVIRWVTKTM